MTSVPDVDTVRCASCGCDVPLKGTVTVTLRAYAETMTTRHRGSFCLMCWEVLESGMRRMTRLEGNLHHI